MSEVTKRIDQLLDERGIDKQTFYDDCHISSAAYSQWNTGKTTPRKSSLTRIADYLGVTYEWIAFGTGTKKAPTNEGERDDELTEYLDMLRTRPECRMLFSLAKGATKDDVERAVAIIEALREKEGR